MKKPDITWKLFGGYLLILLLILMSQSAFGQIKVMQFNAGWNESNSSNYLDKLTDCGVKRILIDKGSWQKDYGIVVVPTIIVFNGEEVERFQADLSFKMLATKEEIQGVVDEIIMSDF